MKKSDKTPKQTHRRADPNVMGLHADVVEQNITETLETNYMPYAMSVIVSRAIPEIDGFKPSHRKLLYTMYKMGLLTGARTKSANIVGQTMRLNPHGDVAIYDTMVRLSKGYGALLHPFVDSKGNFGKVYSRDMAWAASRYTEAKLAPICAELFRDIDSDTVDFVDNYDNSMKEPALLPTTFPNILVSANQGIAVGMASQLCGFNLGEVCDTTIAFLKNPEVRISETLLAPDFPTGGSELGAWIVRSHVERLSIGNICLGIDLTIILIYAAVFHSLNNALYGALALYITTKVLDLVVYGQNTAKVAYIISDKYEEIMQEMLRRDMGVTLLNGKGGYTGAERPLLFCAIRKKEAVSIKRYIKELDPDAFFIVCDASEVLGEGFGEYDPQGL